MKGPKYSIVLPTFNRAAFLPLAVESVLNQTFEDFELVISDGGSTDDTVEVVGGFSDDRIRLVTSKTKLTMAENYERALDHAAGEFVIFFSDDDAFVPDMLERVDEAISESGAKMLVFQIAYFHHENILTANGRVGKNSLSVPRCTEVVSEVPSEAAIKRTFSVVGLSDEKIDMRYLYPLIGNVVCNRLLLERLKEKTGNLFGSVPIDIFFITLVLSAIRSYVVIDAPLLVCSQWSQNSSVGVLPGGKRLQEHYEKLLDGEEMEFVPLKFALPLNCSANAVLKAREVVGGHLKALEPNWGAYFSRTFDELVYLNTEGVDVADELKEFQKVLSGQREDIRSRVPSSTPAVVSKIKRFMKTTPLPISRVWRSLRNWNSGAVDPRSQMDIVASNEGHFENFLQGAEYLFRKRDKTLRRSDR